MSDRLVRGLIIALAALVAIYGIVRLISGRGGASDSPYDLAGIANAEIDSVIIEGETGKIRLRQADGWEVNGYEAMAEAGDALERALEAASVAEVISRNPENHERLGVEEDQGRRLRVFAGEERIELIISGKGQSFDDAYVRRPDDDEVRVMRGNLVDLVRRSVDGWRNKQIVSASAADVQRVEFALSDTSFALVRDSAGWQLIPPGQPAEDQAADALARELAGLRAIGFAADSVTEALSWDEPAGRVRVLGAGDAELGELTFLARETSGYYVKRADKPVVFTLSQYSGDQVLKRPDELAGSTEQAASGEE